MGTHSGKLAEQPQVRISFVGGVGHGFLQLHGQWASSSSGASCGDATVPSISLLSCSLILFLTFEPFDFLFFLADGFACFLLLSLSFGIRR